MLISVKGDAGRVNKWLLLKAFEKAPSLVLDCGNSADPHMLFPQIREEQLHSVYVMNAEAIYRFRDALLQIPYWSRRLGTRCLAITTIHALFSYDNPDENYNVLEHCWELMKGLSADFPVYVGISDDKLHTGFAERFADERAVPVLSGD